jgi:hypothetical protein
MSNTAPTQIASAMKAGVTMTDWKKVNRGTKMAPISKADEVMTSLGDQVIALFDCEAIIGAASRLRAHLVDVCGR